MPREASRVSELSTSVGLGAFTLAGAPAGYRTWDAAFGGVDTVVHYGALHKTVDEWEEGIGTFVASSNAIQRDQPLASSTGGGKVPFSAGNKVIFSVRPAEGPLRVQTRRPTDIGVEIIPTAGQTAALLRLQRAVGGDGFVVDKDGFATGKKLMLNLTVTNGTVLAILGNTDSWEVRQREVMNNEYSLEFAAPANGRRVLVSTNDGASGFSFNPSARIISLYGAGADDFIFDIEDVGTGIDYLFKVDGVNAARIEEAGTTTSGAITVMTRQKGDARYQLSSEARLKSGISILTAVDIQGLHPKRWDEWQMDGHRRNGMPGAGFVYEDVAEVFPEAALPPEEGAPGAIDPLALLAAFVREFRSRLDALET